MLGKLKKEHQVLYDKSSDEDAPHDEGVADPRQTLIIRGEDGQFYRLVKEKWQRPEYVVSDAGGKGMLEQLTNFGTYLAYIPPDMAIGIGHICTLVDLKSILRNNPEETNDSDDEDR